MDKLQCLKDEKLNLKYILENPQDILFTEQQIQQTREQYENLKKQIKELEASQNAIDYNISSQLKPQNQAPSQLEQKTMNIFNQEDNHVIKSDIKTESKIHVIKDSQISSSIKSTTENPEIVKIDKEIKELEENLNELLNNQNLQTNEEHEIFEAQYSSIEISLEQLKNKKKQLQQKSDSINSNEENNEDINQDDLNRANMSHFNFNSEYKDSKLDDAQYQKKMSSVSEMRNQFSNMFLYSGMELSMNKSNHNQQKDDNQINKLNYSIQSQFIKTPSHNQSELNNYDNKINQLNYSIQSQFNKTPSHSQSELNNYMNNIPYQTKQKSSSSNQDFETNTSVGPNINHQLQISLTCPYNTPVVINQDKQYLKEKGFIEDYDQKTEISYLRFNVPKQIDIKKFVFTYENTQQYHKGKGIQIHSIMADYFRSQQQQTFFNPQGLYQSQIKFLTEYAIAVESYLKLRGMKVTGIEKIISCEQKEKRIDLIAENNTECILIDWKFTKQDSWYKIFVDYEEHFLNQIRIQKKLLPKKNVRMLILPLKEIDPIHFIEYSYEDISQIQRNQGNDSRFKKSMLKTFRSNLEINSERRTNQNINEWEKIAIDLIENKNFEKIRYYSNIQNSVNLLFKLDGQECYKNIKDEKDFEQFYYVHLVLCFKLNNKQDISIPEDICSNLTQSMLDLGQKPNYKITKIIRIIINMETTDTMEIHIKINIKTETIIRIETTNNNHIKNLKDHIHDERKIHEFEKKTKKKLFQQQISLYKQYYILSAYFKKQFKNIIYFQFMFYILQC